MTIIVRVEEVSLPNVTNRSQCKTVSDSPRMIHILASKQDVYSKLQCKYSTYSSGYSCTNMILMKCTSVLYIFYSFGSAKLIEIG